MRGNLWRAGGEEGEDLMGWFLGPSMVSFSFLGWEWCNSLEQSVRDDLQIVKRNPHISKDSPTTLSACL